MEIQYQIVAYCSQCHKEITRSAKFNKKKLVEVWDSAILAAAVPGAFPVCPCLKDKYRKGECNYNFDFKIAVFKDDKEEIEEPAQLLVRLRKSLGLPVLTTNQAIAKLFNEVHKPLGNTPLKEIIKKSSK